MSVACEDLKDQGMNRKERIAEMRSNGRSGQCQGCEEKFVCDSQTKNRTSAFKINRMNTKESRKH